MYKKFEDFLIRSNWTDLISHYKSESKSIESNIVNTLKKEGVNQKELRKYIIKKYNMHTIKPDLFEKAKDELTSGNVVGADGTYVSVDFTTGFQARIGVVATNYKNMKKSYTTYVYVPFVDYSKEDLIKQLQELQKGYEKHERINSMHIRAIMLYMERNIILEREEKYKLVQGDIFPFELRTGQGKLRGLSTCLSLGEKLLNDKNIIAIQTSTMDPRLRYIGRSLKPGEYVDLYDYSLCLKEFLKYANFNPNDHGIFERFISNAQGNFRLGIYKFKKRSYVFQCHKDSLEKLIHIVFADSSFQPLRGFPLLLDYADIICTKMLSASDFKNQLEVKLAKHNELEYDINEAELRRR